MRRATFDLGLGVVRVRGGKQKITVWIGRFTRDGFIHLPLIHFASPPRLLIDFKNSKWLTYFGILLCICYCFSHLIGLLSVIWLSLFYKSTRFFIYFLFLSDEARANARNVRLFYPYWQYTDLFIFRFVSLLCLCSTLCIYVYIFSQYKN